MYILWTHEEGKELINTQYMPKLERKFQTVASSVNLLRTLKSHKIEECDGFYRIQVRANGEKVDIKKSGGQGNVRKMRWNPLPKHKIN